MHPVEVCTLAFATCNQSEPFLENRNLSAINQDLREAVIYVHHPKNGARMQGVVILYYEYVPVELFIMLIFSLLRTATEPQVTSIATEHAQHGRHHAWKKTTYVHNLQATCKH